VPFIAAVFGLAAWAGHQVWPYAPVVLLCVGMVAAAVIDGLMFKVPNWLTLPLVLSGWGIGLLPALRGGVGPPGHLEGGLGASVLGTAIGFGLLFPALFIGGMGQGDVKMQMGFGAWVGALYGAERGGWIVVWAVAAGMVVGGVIGLAMILLRGQLDRNAKN